MSFSYYVEEAIKKQGLCFSRKGALLAQTSPCTGRSTKERFIVKDNYSTPLVDWGTINQPLEESVANVFFEELKLKISGRPSYKLKRFVGPFSLELHSTSAWHMAFADNMFRSTPIKDSAYRELGDGIEIFHAPELTVEDFASDVLKSKSDSGVFILLDLKRRRVGIIGTLYAGEIKKSAFTLCNFLLPEKNVFPMHASANCLEDGTQSSVIFGLSGTGKTTLSAAPGRFLIGDDEIAWGEGLSNLEGGCYAKLIHLKEKKEPEIFAAVNRFASIMENVVHDPFTRAVNFDDASITENTRGSYPLSSLVNVFDQERQAETPNTLIFLTADAFGALPAVARLNPAQAQFHFISGYTAKVAGTEKGVTEPTATFSACFGAPFMPRPAASYAQQLAQKAEETGASIWLVNTGWMQGGYGKSTRFPLAVSRKIVELIQTGKLKDEACKKHSVFDFEVPLSADGIESKFLEAPDGPEVVSLAQRFVDNIRNQEKANDGKDLSKGGPNLNH